MLERFWGWYERTYTLNVGVAAGLFLLQITHLLWLTSAVVWARLFGAPLVDMGPMYDLIIAAVDYTEIPALVGVSLIYINELRQGWDGKSVLYLILLNSQWLHLFWITDEMVVERLTQESLVPFPFWLAWVAILIDYAEVPVMIDTVRKFFGTLRRRI
jgi:hypothetical protein